MTNRIYGIKLSPDLSPFQGSPAAVLTTGFHFVLPCTAAFRNFVPAGLRKLLY